jgi:hypothetical protein
VFLSILQDNAMRPFRWIIGGASRKVWRLVGGHEDAGDADTASNAPDGDMNYGTGPQDNYRNIFLQDLHQPFLSVRMCPQPTHCIRNFLHHGQRPHADAADV